MSTPTTPSTPSTPASSRRTRLGAGLLAIALAASAFAGSGQIIRVDLNAPGPGDGASWATAFPDLTDALAFAGPGDQVWIAGQQPGEGVPLEDLPAYRPAPPNGPRDKSFVLPGQVEVYGGFAGNETSLSQRVLGPYFTILSADLNGDDDVSKAENSQRVLFCEAGVEVVLDGVYVVSGNADAGGAPFDRGAGISLYDADVTIRNCSFSLHGAAGPGGALYAENSFVRVENTSFGLNSSNNAGGAGFVSGGAELDMINCSIVANAHTGNNGEAGGVYVSDATANFTNVTVADNTTTQNFGGIFALGDATIANSILWGNDGPQIGLSAAVTHSTVQGGHAGEGNTADDPLFIDPGAFNYRLQDASPALDVASTTAYTAAGGGFSDAGTIQTPLACRFVDAPQAANAGVGVPPVLDRGAYEWQCGDGSVSSCSADLNGNGLVDSPDLNILLGEFGQNCE